ncbi:MAG: aldolase/citrate lyase family protein [Acidobacteriota bacterium]
MRPNLLRQKLDEGLPTVGTHVLIPWPGIVEIVGRTGSFDYVEFVGEYATWSLDLFDNLGRALDLFPEMSSMMKVEEQSKGFIATRALDAGFQSVLFTDVRSADDARECVRLVRPETPEAGGTHGVGMRRIAGYGASGNAAAWVDAMNDVVVALMIEKTGAMEMLDEILAVPGIDMVQFGPADYSITVGKPGDRAAVADVEKRMIEKALEAGVHPRIEVRSFGQAEPYLPLGVRHLCVGWDTIALAAWAKEQSDGARRLLERD